MKEQLKELFNQYAGNLSLSDAKKNGVQATTLDRLVLKGELLKEGPGFYVLPKSMVDELYLAQSIFKRGIISHETALDLYQLSTNIPNEIQLTFPKGYNIKRARVEQFFIRPHYSEKKYYSLGVQKIESFYGNLLTAYDQERTLCDMWHSRYRASDEVREEALKDYMRSSNRDIPKLQFYMDILPVSKEMSYYMRALY